MESVILSDQEYYIILNGKEFGKLNEKMRRKKCGREKVGDKKVREKWKKKQVKGKITRDAKKF